MPENTAFSRTLTLRQKRFLSILYQMPSKALHSIRTKRFFFCHFPKTFQLNQIMDESAVERFAVQIVDTERSIAELDMKIIRAELDLQRYISSVDDSQMRLILQYRFVDCLTWRDVAQRLDCTVTEEVVKMMVSRFIKTEARSQ